MIPFFIKLHSCPKLRFKNPTPVAVLVRVPEAAGVDSSLKPLDGPKGSVAAIEYIVERGPVPLVEPPPELPCDVTEDILDRVLRFHPPVNNGIPNKRFLFFRNPVIVY